MYNSIRKSTINIPQITRLNFCKEEERPYTKSTIMRTSHNSDSKVKGKSKRSLI